MKHRSIAMLFCAAVMAAPTALAGELAVDRAQILKLAPERQISWARDYARSATDWPSAKTIEGAVKRAFPRDSRGMQVQTRLLTALEISGAMLDFLDSRPGDLARKVQDVRAVHAKTIRNFAHSKPPRAYEGSQTMRAARAQGKAQRYTQFVQLSTQLMGEVQSTERELIDVLQTMKRDLGNHWQAYASLRDNDFRTSERIMTIR